jgi:hypothetical protein
MAPPSGIPPSNEKTSARLLDPIDRISEVLFGLIMVLTSTGTLSVVSAGRAEVKTMILGGLGCNLAWGIIDAGMYLMGCLNDRGHSLRLSQDIRKATSPQDARQRIADELPEPIALALSQEQLELLRQKIASGAPFVPSASLTKDDLLSALAVCILVFFSTFPVIIPFFFFANAQPALRISNAIAVIMLFLCGYAFGRCTGYRPWLMGLVMIGVGCVLVGVAIALGG